MRRERTQVARAPVRPRRPERHTARTPAVPELTEAARASWDTAAVTSSLVDETMGPTARAEAVASLQRTVGNQAVGDVLGASPIPSPSRVVDAAADGAAMEPAVNEVPEAPITATPAGGVTVAPTEAAAGTAPAAPGARPFSAEPLTEPETEGTVADERPALAPAVSDAGSPGRTAGGGDDVVLHMPEAPADLTPEALGRVEAVQAGGRSVAVAQVALPSAGETVGEARAAVTEPSAEATARAEGGVVAALEQRAAPSAEIETLCAQITKAIHEKRPPDEASLVHADPEAMAQGAQGQFDQSVRDDVDRVGSEYDAVQSPPPAEPGQVGQPMEPPPLQVGAANLDAAQAAPDPVAAENVSLDADVAATQERVAAAGMTSEAAALVETGPVADARAATDELAQTAEQAPAEVLAGQQDALVQASADMVALQERALAAMSAARAGSVGRTTARQAGMVESEEATRVRVGTEARRVFEQARSDVRALLDPLPQTAMQKWERGAAVLATEFKQRLHEVEVWLAERHSGVVGAVVEWLDRWAMPSWVTEAYDDAETTFGQGVCDLIREISAEVNTVVASCESIIARAHEAISELFRDLGPGLQDWAAAEQGRFSAELDGLREQVTTARDNFDRDLMNRARQSVQEVRQQIHALREKAKGIIGRALAAVGAFLEDPARAILEGLLTALGIPPASFWALVEKIQHVVADIAADPLRFANNLLSALAKGFQQFFDRAAEHLLDGLLGWLFSGLGSVGVSIPPDFSLQSVITFFLQVMGISWARIRKLLAKHLGEENVALVEKAYELVSSLIEMGPTGIFELIKEKLDPKALLDQVLQAAVDFLVEAVVKAVTVRIIALFNPAGAILQAVEAIYRVLAWVFQNAARIFKLVETVVNGIADVFAGNIGGLANAIETALASLIAPVIDFIADYVGIGDLPERIAKVIEGFQQWVEGILDKVIGWLADRAKALLRSLGIGGEEAREGPSGYDGEIGRKIDYASEDGGHSIWVVTNGTDAVVMVASEPMTLERQLVDFAKRAKDLPEAKRKHVTDEIAEVRAALQEIDTQSDALAMESKQPTPDAQKVRRLDDAVEKAEAGVVRHLKVIRQALGLASTLGSPDKPVPIERWPKRAAQGYPVLHLLDRGAEVRKSRRYAIAADERPAGEGRVTKFYPCSPQALPDGTQIGLAPHRQLAAGTTLEVSETYSSRGGGKINRVLEPYGWSATDEGMDGDHVLERQLGGEDELFNLWPLDASENRGAGSALSQMRFGEGDDAVAMPELKERIKKHEHVWFKILGTK